MWGVLSRRLGWGCLGVRMGRGDRVARTGRGNRGEARWAVSLPEARRCRAAAVGWVQPSAPASSPDRPAQAPSLGLAGSLRGARTLVAHPAPSPLLVREEQGTAGVKAAVRFTALGPRSEVLSLYLYQY